LRARWTKRAARRERLSDRRWTKRSAWLAANSARACVADPGGREIGPVDVRHDFGQDGLACLDADAQRFE